MNRNSIISRDFFQWGGGIRNHSPPGYISSVQFSCSVVSVVTPWTTARQASLPITNSRSSLKLMSIESVMPSSHLILCRPLLLPPAIFPSIRVFSNELALRIRWPKYWSFSFSISTSNEYSTSSELTQMHSFLWLTFHCLHAPQLREPVKQLHWKSKMLALFVSD